jgi:thiol:disulfide interchange protein DsbD
MRRITVFFFLCFLFTVNFAQSQNHVQWKLTWDAKRQGVVLTAAIDPAWHMYSPKTDPNLGPIPLKVIWEKNKVAKTVGDFEFLTEPIAHEDQNFGGTVYIWETKMEGFQKIKLKKATQLKVTVNYMVCDETMCLPPIDVSLSIQLKP